MVDQSRCDSDIHVVISHNEPTFALNYRKFKGKIIAHFGTARAAARTVGCHYNSIRLAGLGRCPKVLKRLEPYLK